MPVCFLSIFQHHQQYVNKHDDYLFSASNLSILFQRRFTKDSCSCSSAFSNSTFSRLSYKQHSETDSYTLRSCKNGISIAKANYESLFWEQRLLAAALIIKCDTTHTEGPSAATQSNIHIDTTKLRTGKLLYVSEFIHICTLLIEHIYCNWTKDHGGFNYTMFAVKDLVFHYIIFKSPPVPEYFVLIVFPSLVSLSSSSTCWLGIPAPFPMSAPTPPSPDATIKMTAHM